MSATPAVAAPLSDILTDDVSTGVKQRFVLVGGKGGVGKTSTSAALAVRCADAGFKTLVASTDPAHSLGDALQQDLSGGKPVPVPGCDLLEALEVDPTEAINRFRAAVTAFRPSDLGLGGVAEQLVEQLGLEDFADILDDPPPGLDELLALAEVVELTTGGELSRAQALKREALQASPAGDRGAPADVIDVTEMDPFASFDARLGATPEVDAEPRGAGSAPSGAYARILLDTAPTGHTMRLLALPTFIDSLLNKLLTLRGRLKGLLATAERLGLVGAGMDAKVAAAAERLEGWRDRVAALKQLLTDEEMTDFCVVTVPTEVAVAETERLLGSLAEQRVPVRHLVINQVVTPQAKEGYLGRLRKGQDRALAQLLEAKAAEWRDVNVHRVNYYDMEFRGVYPLRFLGERAFGDDSWASVLTPVQAGDADLRAGGNAGNCRFVVVGGKGGVGKTSSSAALALRCADSGLRTLVVSTDPAHSLGDVLEVDLAGKQEPVAVEEASHRKLFALEVDPEEAARAFQDAVRALGSEAKAADADLGGAGGGGDMLNQLAGQLGLSDFAEVLDTLPPGLDELVALAKVVSLLEQGALGEPFDRIIIDTAPTGHTLRLLKFPDFLDTFITRLLRLRDRLKGASAVLGGAADAVRSMFGGPAARTPPRQASADADAKGGAADRLRDFQRQMRLLSTILHDPARAEFCIVTIPTDLALLESNRLRAALRKDGVAVNHLVVNRIVDVAEDGGVKFVERLSKGHGKSVARAREIASSRNVDVTTVPFFDTETTGLPGLRAFSLALLRPQTGDE